MKLVEPHLLAEYGLAFELFPITPQTLLAVLNILQTSNAQHRPVGDTSNPEYCKHITVLYVVKFFAHSDSCEWRRD